MKQTKRFERTTLTASGFSIVELLVAVMIIGILASVVTPMLSKHAAQARVTVCQEEVQRLADAQERCMTSIGYYVRLFVLDDIAAGDGVGFGNANDRRDGIGDEPQNGVFQNSTRIFIRPENHEIITTQLAQNVFTNILKVDTTTDMAENWDGPYFTINSDEDIQDPRTPLHYYGIPNDPWGNDYLLFVRGDITNGVQSGVVLEPSGVVQGTLSANGVSADATVFGRLAILSLGPNGMPGDGTGGGVDGQLGGGDDIYVEFGS